MEATEYIRVYNNKMCPQLTYVFVSKSKITNISYLSYLK